MIQEVCGSFGTFLTKSDEREEELLKFLNNVNCESWHFGNIWYNYKTRISDPIFCRRFIPFQKEFQVKDWDLRLFNCDILKKTWIISGLEEGNCKLVPSAPASAAEAASADCSNRQMLQ